MNKVRDRYLEGMKGDRSPTSAIGRYLAYMRSEGDEGAVNADELSNDLVKTFTTPEGLKVLMMMEKSVLYTGVSDGSPDSALREANAVRNFVLEIRRIVSNGRR